MAVQRRMNWLGQERVEVGHLRMLESAVAGDFDALGYVIARDSGYVVKGLSLTNGVGSPATSLILSVADARFVSWRVAESGSFFVLPKDARDDALNMSNTRLVGGFTPNTTNYISLDVVSIADPASEDTVRFKDADTGDEFPTSMPVSRVIDWRVFVSTVPFSSTTARLRIATVVTDASNNVVSITDSRQMLFRLFNGGTAAARSLAVENSSTATTLGSDPFSGGDKGLFSLREWMEVVMTRLWAIGGGQYWYSETVGRNFRLLRSGPTFSGGDYFDWNAGAGTLSWKGLSMAFEGGSNGAYYNTIPDGTNVALAVGSAIGVTLDLTSNGNVVETFNVPLSSYVNGTPNVGGRVLIAWRTPAGVFYRDQAGTVSGGGGSPATTSAYGLVKLLTTPPDSTNSTFAIIADNKGTNNTYLSATAAGLTRGATGTEGSGSGVLKVGHGGNDTSIELGQSGRVTNVMGTLDVHGASALESDVTVSGLLTALARIAATGTTTRGALSLTPQTNPSSPSNGDVWVDSSTGDLKAQLSGATVALATKPYVDNNVSTDMMYLTGSLSAGWYAGDGTGTATRKSSTHALLGFAFNATVSSGATTTVFTFPAGWQPAKKWYGVGYDSSGAVVGYSVDTSGAMVLASAPVVGRTYYFMLSYAY